MYGELSSKLSVNRESRYVLDRAQRRAGLFMISRWRIPPVGDLHEMEDVAGVGVRDGTMN